MKYLKQFTIILGICLLGDLVRFLLPLPIPASVSGVREKPFGGTGQGFFVTG